MSKEDQILYHESHDRAVARDRFGGSGRLVSNGVTLDRPLAETIQLLRTCSQEISAHTSLSRK
jgi:hypothetical protein